MCIAPVITLSPEQQTLLEGWARSRSFPARAKENLPPDGISSTRSCVRQADLSVPIWQAVARIPVSPTNQNSPEKWPDNARTLLCLRDGVTRAVAAHLECWLRTHLFRMLKVGSRFRSKEKIGNQDQHQTMNCRLLQ